MKKPKMILFDYGQTLINEEKFNGLEGTKAVMQYAVKNKHGYSCEAVNKYYTGATTVTEKHDEILTISSWKELKEELSRYE